jgi:hypothetical protein
MDVSQCSDAALTLHMPVAMTTDMECQASKDEQTNDTALG